MNVSYLSRLNAIEMRAKYEQLEEINRHRDLTQQELQEFLYLATPVLELDKANPPAERDANGAFVLQNAVCHGSRR